MWWRASHARRAGPTTGSGWIVITAPPSPVRSQLGLSPAPQAQLKLLEAQPRAAALSDLRDGFARATAPPASLPMPHRRIFNMWGGDDVVNDAPVKSYELTKSGFVLTLNDGQVWAQTEEHDASKHPVRWRQPAIRHCASASARARWARSTWWFGDENRQHKVKRVR